MVLKGNEKQNKSDLLVCSGEKTGRDMCPDECFVLFYRKEARDISKCGERALKKGTDGVPFIKAIKTDQCCC